MMIEINNVNAAAMDNGVHSPGNSNTHDLRNSSEKPNMTVMAVMTPLR
jgi:hypothetical protein